MASSQSPNRLYFTSYDRQSSDINTDFTINFDTPIQNAYNYEVVTASFPNLFKSFAKYETVLYFYHELLNGGAVAIGIPMAPILGGAGEEFTTRPPGREQYINERYFLDGDELAQYITAWLVSLQVGASAWPAAGIGLRPFYFPNDDPTVEPVEFTSEADINAAFDFNNIVMNFDNASTGTGSLRMTLNDLNNAIRVASIVDFGLLSFTVPSQLGWKLGFTDLFPAAFGTDSVSITGDNNVFNIILGSRTIPITIPVNDYSVDGLAAKIQEVVRATTYDFGGSFGTLGFLGSVFSIDSLPGPTYKLQFSLTVTGNAPVGATFGILGGSAATVLGLGTSLVPTASVTPTAVAIAPDPIVTNVAITPDLDRAPDTINLIRTANVYFASSLSSGESQTSSGRKDILFAVPLTADVGGIQLYQSTLSGIVINRPPSTIRNVSLALLDDNFQVLEPLAQNASVVVEVHFAYNEDAKASQVDKRSTNLYA